jgi:hypothetical protein
VRNNSHSEKLTESLGKNSRTNIFINNTIIENLKIIEKINTKFFKACERGEIEKILALLGKTIAPDRRPNINEKYMHNYTVLHIAITNS